MLRSDILEEVYLLLNETSSGTWDDDELRALGKDAEEDLISMMPEQFIQGLLKEDKTFNPASPDILSWISGKSYDKPADFFRIKTLKGNTVPYPSYTEVVRDELDKYTELAYFNPGDATFPTHIYFWDSKGIAIAPSATDYYLAYYKVPDVWTSDNNPSAPDIDVATHRLIIYYMVWQALLDDGEIVSADKYEKKYKEGVVKLGGKLGERYG